MWSEITNDEVMIKDYHYTNPVEVKNEITLNVYKGASNTPESIKYSNGGKVQYRQVFHDEHVIPIAVIIDRLVKLDNESALTPQNVRSVLDGIYICRMLKDENVKLGSKGYKTKRRETLKETIEEIYIKECGIEIVDWDKIKDNL